MFRLVSLPSRAAVEPMCNSERERSALQMRSPLASGRLGTAAFHSSTPGGEKLTLPSMALKRATRPGGSMPVSVWAKALPVPRATSSRALAQRRTVCAGWKVNVIMFL